MRVAVWSGRCFALSRVEERAVGARLETLPVPDVAGSLGVSPCRGLRSTPQARVSKPCPYAFPSTRSRIGAKARDDGLVVRVEEAHEVEPSVGDPLELQPVHDGVETARLELALGRGQVPDATFLSGR